MNPTQSKHTPSKQSKPISIENAANHLHELLLDAVKNPVKDAKEVAIAFSGGLDSGMLAFLAKKCDARTQLITVGLENSPETLFAEQAAEALGMPIHVQIHSLDDVEEAVPRVLRLINDSNPVNVGIAIPFFWTAKAVAEHGLKVLLAGQGADELFGGYHRYLSMYSEEGEETLAKALAHDFMLYRESGFRRDAAVCEFHGVELRLPYTESRVADFALSLPVSFKIESPGDTLRKRVLRSAAENSGVPIMIALRGKKAVQYASGVDRALRKLARKENLSTSEYCKKLFTQKSSADVTNT